MSRRQPKYFEIKIFTVQAGSSEKRDLKFKVPANNMPEATVFGEWVAGQYRAGSFYKLVRLDSVTRIL